MKIDTYYDACCSMCGRNLSTDFNYSMQMNKDKIKEILKKEGWIYKKGNICPMCQTNK